MVERFFFRPTFFVIFALYRRSNAVVVQRVLDRFIHVRDVRAVENLSSFQSVNDFKWMEYPCVLIFDGLHSPHAFFWKSFVADLKKAYPFLHFYITNEKISFPSLFDALHVNRMPTVIYKTKETTNYRFSGTCSVKLMKFFIKQQVEKNKD